MKTPSTLELKRREELAARNYRHGHTAGAPSATWKSWRAMMVRCYNPKHPAYTRYGGKGIQVCQEWQDFIRFLADMGERPTGCTLDRKDGSKGYSQENCRWATVQEQNENKAGLAWIEYAGLRLTQAEWSRRTGIGMTTLCWRLKHGWPVERILNRYKAQQ